MCWSWTGAGGIKRMLTIREGGNNCAAPTGSMVPSDWMVGGTLATTLLEWQCRRWSW
jgi:hypothetical protein